ncbi:hypothetical protein CK203_049709 [Vitis vinifera]|uniref:Uncharacterized protein n=1 Tax=Vitis vinifera TaxID=29760 RepID=A0A438H186_VITVI
MVSLQPEEIQLLKSEGKVNIEAKAGVKLEIPNGAVVANKVINGPQDI